MMQELIVNFKLTWLDNVTRNRGVAVVAGVYILPPVVLKATLCSVAVHGAETVVGQTNELSKVLKFSFSSVARHSPKVCVFFCFVHLFFQNLHLAKFIYEK